MDVSLRGAVSIARRLQDPLAELVKIDPKSIGVGQYQHDLSEVKLSRSLDAVVEDCVNGVGVDVNTASARAARPRVRRHLRSRREHRGAPGRERAVHVADRAEEGVAARPEGVRAVRGLPADPGRQRPAGRVQRAPRGVPGGTPDGEDRRAGGGRPDRQHVRAAVARAGGVRERDVRSADGHGHSEGAGEAGARPAARLSRRPPSRRAWRRSPTCPPGWSWRVS